MTRQELVKEIMRLGAENNEHYANEELVKSNIMEANSLMKKFLGKSPHSTHNKKLNNESK